MFLVAVASVVVALWTVEPSKAQLLAKLYKTGTTELLTTLLTDGVAGSEPMFTLTPFNVSVDLWLEASSEALEIALIHSPSVGEARRVLSESDPARQSSVVNETVRVVVLDVGSPLIVPVVYSCVDSFTLIDRFEIAFRSLAGLSSGVNVTAAPFQFAQIRWFKDCRLPGCTDRCDVHGSCTELLGECVCDAQFYADECQLKLTITDPCPGGDVVVSWDNPGDRRTNGDWYALFPANYTDLLADPIDWRYMYSLDKVVVNEVEMSEYHLVHTYTATMPNTVEPGDYIMFIFKDDGYDIFAQVPFKVKPWAECGVRDSSCSSDATCSGHGKCVQRACQCDEGFSFWDCSRGCSSAPVTLGDSTGKIDTGVYNNKQTCTWVIAPTGAFNEIVLNIESVRLDPGDLVRIETAIVEDEEGGATPMPTAAPANTVGPELSAGYRVHNDITQSAGASTMTITTDKPVRVLLYADTTNVAPGLIASYEARLGPRQLTGGEIAGIVIGSLAAAILLVVGAVLLTQWFQKQQQARTAAAEAAANTDALGWTVEQEADAIPAAKRTSDETDTIQLGALNDDVMSLQRSGTESLFAPERGMRCQVATELTDSFTLVNRLDKPVAYEVSVPIDDDAFVCRARPGVGVLAPRESRVIHLTFVLNYTCKVWRYVKVTCDDVAGLYAVPIMLEGEPSSRLDPNGIELFSKPIGDGAFGVVYRGRWRGADIAVKVPKRQGEMNDAHLKAFKEEIALFEKLRNPYIVGFVGASHVPGKLCLCTELLERGTVLSLLQKAKLSLVLKVKLMLDAAHALAFLHQNGVLYRDLKTENLLVFSVSHTAPVNCKLADFGSAIAVTDPSTPLEHSRHVGTPIYMAPEVMNSEPYMSAVDVYSLAIIMWELLAEVQPYAQVKRLWELPKLVLEGARPALQEWDEELCELISRCWLHTPTRRPSALQVVDVLEPIWEHQKKVYDQSKKTKKKMASERHARQVAAHRRAGRAVGEAGDDAQSHAIGWSERFDAGRRQGRHWRGGGAGGAQVDQSDGQLDEEEEEEGEGACVAR
jgi:hypothetical protein